MKLIVEMEMPRNCDECEVNYDCAFCGITGSAFYGNTQMPNFMPDKQKLPDCPIVGVLPEEPTVDAVPVRCKECLWRHDDSSPMWLPCMERETPDDWFCADGERIEHEQIHKD